MVELRSTKIIQSGHPDPDRRIVLRDEAAKLIGSTERTNFALKTVGVARVQKRRKKVAKKMTKKNRPKLDLKKIRAHRCARANPTIASYNAGAAATNATNATNATIAKNATIATNATITNATIL
jgi:hypothetical protein